jgi:hypothetical protein
MTRVTLAWGLTLVATAAAAAVGAVSAGATVGDGDVVLGTDQIALTCAPFTDPNCESTTTGILNRGSSDAFEAFANGGGDGVLGFGANGVHGISISSTDSGVWGDSEGSGYGVTGSTSTTGLSAPAGVWGENFESGPGVLGTSVGGRGLSGRSTDYVGVYGTGPAGVLGFSTASGGTGTEGASSSKSGVGVLASNSKGQALEVVGGASFRGTTTFARSGMLTVSPGSSKATETGLTLRGSSLVLTTIQDNVAGVWVQGATTISGARGSFTVHLNKASPVQLKVAWLIVN